MKCFICGCVYKNEGYLRKVFENIKIIQSLFDETKIIISYDNSGDNSLKELCELKKEGFDIDIMINKTHRYLDWIGRCYNIGKARNSIINRIYNIDYDTNSKDKECNYDFFIMMDMDDVNCVNINIDILKKYLSQNYIDKWDCLSFYNKGYYDTWALSIDDYQDSSWHQLDNDKKSIDGYKYNKEFLSYFKNKMDNLNGDMMKIDSAFNGFCIHKIDKFKGIKYKPFTILYDELIIDIEHRGFYKEANKKGLNVMISKDYLFDKQITEHNI
tara:strand:- start:2307 stop:3119 length:813 start_codon:yes stop_codon:yes gene_type:complete